jgi:hypothetical protein
MERKQGIDFRLGACASEDAERRMPRVQNMWSGEENTQVTIHALVRGVTNLYRQESNCGVTKSPMDWNKQDHTLSVTGVMTELQMDWHTGSHVICYRRYQITLQTMRTKQHVRYKFRGLLFIFIMVEVVIYLQIYWLFWNVFHSDKCG